MTRFNTLATTIALAAASFAVANNAAAQLGTTPAQRGASGAAEAKAGAKADAKTGAPSGADQKFVMEAAKGGMAEVALGKLAQQKGGSDAVKQFGAQMVEDHGKANDELMKLASAKGITLPTEPPKDAKAQKMEGMMGSAFDAAYRAEMLTAHKKDIALFEKESRGGADADIKAFATKTLPTLKGHLQMLQADSRSGAAMKH